MQKECPKCNYYEFEVVPTNDIHRIKTICANCGAFIQFGRMLEDLEDGQHEFILELAEEINKTFILFKLVNDKANLKKQIWKDEQGRYSNNLNNFIKSYSFMKNNFVDLYSFLEELEGRRVIATVENIIRKGKKICEVKFLDKIL